MHWNGWANGIDAAVCVLWCGKRPEFDSSFFFYHETVSKEEEECEELGQHYYMKWEMGTSMM